TYYGGIRDEAMFDVDDPKFDAWEDDVQHVRELFTSLAWYDLSPSDALITSLESRTADQAVGTNPVSIAPPARTYWALAELGETYVGYVRGLTGEATLSFGAVGSQTYFV